MNTRINRVGIINNIEMKKISIYYEEYYREEKAQYLREMNEYINRLRELDHERHEVK